MQQQARGYSTCSMCRAVRSSVHACIPPYIRLYHTWAHMLNAYVHIVVPVILTVQHFETIWAASFSPLLHVFRPRAPRSHGVVDQG
jgi:hypothetical protein